MTHTMVKLSRSWKEGREGGSGRKEVEGDAYLNACEGGILVCQHNEVVGLHIDHPYNDVFPPVLPQHVQEVVPDCEQRSKYHPEEEIVEE